LQTALSLAALWLALRAARGRDARPALVAAVLIGLGVANHSLLAGLVGWELCWRPALACAETRPPHRAGAGGVSGRHAITRTALARGWLFGPADHGANNLVWRRRTHAGAVCWWVVSAHTFTVSKPWQGQLPQEFCRFSHGELGEVFAFARDPLPLLLAPAQAFALGRLALL